MSNRDTWHLECNDKIFVNKLLAIREHIVSKQAIRFNAPSVYNNFNFSVPITETLEQLSVRQAHTLRDSHEQVQIFYSGGCDSHYVLETFLANSIKIDKIIMVKSGYTRSDFEIDDYAIPFVKKLNIPFEIRMPDHKYYEQYYYKNPHVAKTQNEYWHHFRLNNHFENVQDEGPHTVNIFGKEKPTVLYKNNEWYTYFLDIDITAQPGQFNFFVNDPVIHAKQCQILVDNIVKHLPVTEYSRVTHFNQHQDFWNKSIGRYSKVNFPLKVLEINGHFNNKDQWAVEDASEDLVSAWKQRNKKLIETHGADWFNSGDPAIGTVGVFSKFYGLTTNIIKTVDDLFPDGFFIQ